MDPQDRDEYLLSQYLDGQLSGPDLGELEERLGRDPELTQLLDELGRTDRLVRDQAGPIPELNWERFADQIVVKRQALDAARGRRRMLRIYGPLAAAAALAIVTTLSLTFNKTDRIAQEPIPVDSGPSQLDDVDLEPGESLLAVVRVALVRPTGLEIINAAPDQPLSGALALAGAGALEQTAQWPEQGPYF